MPIFAVDSIRKNRVTQFIWKAFYRKHTTWIRHWISFTHMQTVTQAVKATIALCLWTPIIASFCSNATQEMCRTEDFMLHASRSFRNIATTKTASHFAWKFEEQIYVRFDLILVWMYVNFSHIQDVSAASVGLHDRIFCSGDITTMFFQYSSISRYNNISSFFTTYHSNYNVWVDFLFLMLHLNLYSFGVNHNKVEHIEWYCRYYIDFRSDSATCRPEFGPDASFEWKTRIVITNTESR